MDTTHLYAVIMAGGKGERFWPAGRVNQPKQLLPLTGNVTMIEETVQRLFPLLSPERILVITNSSYVERIQSLLPIPQENIIGEPVGRDTAPCVALAAALVARRDPDATMILLPADHVIRPAKQFQETLFSAAKQAQNGVLVTLGITPTFAATGYGYIHTGAEISPGFYRVQAFKEKPDAQTAELFFLDGNYKWNSGMFIWQVKTIIREFEQHLPSLAKKISLWRNGGDYHLDFAQCEKISIDYAIMEKTQNVIVGNAPFYWNDLGSWSSLRSILPVDANGNATKGEVITLDAQNNVIISDDCLIGVINMHDIAVIKSGNGILISPLTQEQRVKELVKIIGEKKETFL